MPDSEFYSSLGVKYEEAFAHDSGLITFTEGTLTHLPRQALILDVGCGTGKPVATTLAATGHRIIGIDIADKMIELSRAAVPEGSFEVADMRSYTPPEKELDAVFNILSLFLLNREEMEEMTLKWASWVRKGGILCICTMAAEDLEPEAKNSKYDPDGACARDIEVLFMGSRVKITLFTRNGWATVLKKAGFEILSTKTELFTPPKEANSDPEPHLYIVAKKI